MKHVLMPTDFTIGSLQPVHTAMAHFPEAEIKITLLHLLDMPTGIGDLLLRSARRQPTHLATPEFKKACEIIRNKYHSRIKEMNIVFRYGTTKFLTQNVLEGLKVDAIAYDPNHAYKEPTKDSVQMVPLLQKSGFPIIAAQAARQQAPATVSFGSLLIRETPLKANSFSGA